MKTRFISVVMAAAVLLSACHLGKRLTKANVDEVAEGMSKKQVESILGPPTAIDTTDLIVLKKTTYTYKQGGDIVTIVFRDEKVASKESTLHD
jgi:hypothetical protein